MHKKTLLCISTIFTLIFSLNILSKNTPLTFYFQNNQTSYCKAPKRIQIVNTSENHVDIQITDSLNTRWEYYLQPNLAPPILGSTQLTNNPNLTLRNTLTGAPLTASTLYDLYIRSNCGGGKRSEWIGPITFKTACPLLKTPFSEDFEVTSTTLECWTTLNEKNTTTTSNWMFYFSPFDAHFSKKSARYKSEGSNDSLVDNYLISPNLAFDPSKIYRLEYYYKNGSQKNDLVDFDVFALTKKNGQTIEKPIVAQNSYTNSSYVKKVVFIQAITGNANIVWRINSKLSQTLYLDNITLNEVLNCPEPLDIFLKKATTKEAEVHFSDSFSTTWEYLLAEDNHDGTFPSTKPITTSKNNLKLSNDNNGNALKSNTNYILYIRSICKSGNFSDWSIPLKFTTPCGLSSLPFNEGFNTNSKTSKCWGFIYDTNKTYTPTFRTFGQYEGDGAFNITKYDFNKKETTDFWLITPKFKLDKNKYYKLKYHYNASAATSSYNNKFEIKAATKGITPKDFTTLIFPTKVYKTSSYEENTVYFTGINGETTLGFHFSSLGSSIISIDNVSLEEIDTCPGPIDIKIITIKDKESTFSWTDTINTAGWEFYVQRTGMGIPTTKGTQVNKKTITITKDNTNTPLAPRTSYDFYVRAKCDINGYSKWSEALPFQTDCTTITVPYFENFEANSIDKTCWTMDTSYDRTITAPYNRWFLTEQSNLYEKNAIAFFSQSLIQNDTKTNFILNSPPFTVSTGSYILKYKYKNHSTTTPSASIKVQMTSINATGNCITNVLNINDKLSRQTKEDILTFQATNGVVQFAFIANSPNEKGNKLYIDNFSLQKIETCIEPINVTPTQSTSTSITLTWDQLDSNTNWEVIYLPIGAPIPIIPKHITQVQGTPKTVLTGLPNGQGFTIYVRSKCANTNLYSEWSTGVDYFTHVGQNNFCDGAIPLYINQTLQCKKANSISTLSATLSNTPIPICWTNGYTNINAYDIWFEFTATATLHTLRIFDAILANTLLSTDIEFDVAIYDTICPSFLNPVICFTTTSSSLIGEQLQNLIPGKKYYIRLGNTKQPPLYQFSLCIGTHDKGQIEVYPSGVKYSVDDLIKEVLVKSNCNLVSNIQYQNGDGSTTTKRYNTIGYFNKAKTDFPFNEGIVLSTNEVSYIPRSHQDVDTFRGGNNHRWTGNKEILDLIADAGGAPFNKQDMRITQVSFDFIPIKETIQFEYLLASNSYHFKCGSVGCEAGALFGAWLIDSTTGEGQNLAKIPGTNTSISINNITNSSKTKKSCTSNNPHLYWKHYTPEEDNPIGSFFDFVGLTKPMSTESINVIPGRKYNIKLAVMDFCEVREHSTAVFLNANSFNLGQIDLGPDLLIANNTALCEGTSLILKSSISPDNATIQWYKNAVKIKDATAPNLEIFQPGNYTIKVDYKSLACHFEGAIKIEMYPSAITNLNPPLPIEICRQSKHPIMVNLKAIEPQILGTQQASNYRFSYYKTQNEALVANNNIENPENYQIPLQNTEQTLYIRIENLNTGCSKVLNWEIKPIIGESPNQQKNITICGRYTFPALGQDQYYYTKSGGEGENYNAGDIITTSGIYTFYVLKENKNSCYEEITYQVTIKEPITADTLEDIELTCERFILPTLSNNNHYFTKPYGKGIKITAGTIIEKTQQIYIYAEQEGSCIDQSTFWVKYNDCDIPKGISPNADGINDSLDLSLHEVTSVKIYNRLGHEVYRFQGHYTNQWQGQDKKGRLVSSGTYYYVIQSYNQEKTGWIQVN